MKDGLWGSLELYERVIFVASVIVLLLIKVFETVTFRTIQLSLIGYQELISLDAVLLHLSIITE